MPLQQEKVFVSVLQLADDWLISYAKIAGERLRPTRFQCDLYPLMAVVTGNNLTFRQFRLPEDRYSSFFQPLIAKFKMSRYSVGSFV